MPIFTEKQFNYYIDNSKINLKVQVYLIYGDRLLVNQSFRKIIKTILPKYIYEFDMETFYDNVDDVIKLVKSINTFSLLQNGKLVVLRNSKILKSKREANFKIESLENNESDIQNKKNIFSIIKNVINKGLPNKHYLILLFDTIDKQTNLFKTISNKGIIVNCLIPKDGTQYSRKLQQSLIYRIINKLLSENKKTMDKEIYQLFFNNIANFDLDTFSKIFIKLVDYVGEKEHITIEDANKIFKKNKKNPIFALTNALIKQDLIQSLVCLNSLLLNNVHALQILVGITNKIRKLVLAKDFIVHEKNKTWQSGQSFAYFKTNTLEAVKKYDEHTQKLFNELSDMFKSTRGNLKRVMMLLTGNNPYTAYITILEADKLKEKFLFYTMKLLTKADKQLRLQNANPKSILESVIFSICNNFKS